MDFAVYNENGEGIEGAECYGSCVLCRGEAVTDEDLIKFLLNKVSLTREQAVEIMCKDIIPLNFIKQPQSVL
jgi:hypothetical protein